MKILNLLALSILAYMAIALVSCESGSDAASGMPDDPKYKLSYSYGVQMAMALQNSGLSDAEKSPEKFIEGLKVAFSGDSATFANAQKTLGMRKQSPTPTEDPTEAANIAYCVGLTTHVGAFAQEVEIPEADFDLEAVKKGYVTGIKNDSLLLTNVVMDSFLQAYFKPKYDEYSAIMQAKQQAMAAKAIDEGKKFLAENGQREGVKTTASGLQYEVIKEGTGPKPTAADKVKTHYHGTLTDGSIFDSSVDRGEPITFPLNGVIPGWQEGIPLMSKGAKYRLFIPQELAYGMQAKPGIPAGSCLIFEVELLDINPAE